MDLWKEDVCYNFFLVYRLYIYMKLGAENSRDESNHAIHYIIHTLIIEWVNKHVYLNKISDFIGSKYFDSYSKSVYVYI